MLPPLHIVFCFRPQYNLSCVFNIREEGESVAIRLIVRIDQTAKLLTSREHLSQARAILKDGPLP
jgi:hypothetical protein